MMPLNLRSFSIGFLALWTSISLSKTLIQGREAPPEDFPATVWLGMCTGTIVGERVLLTAAHCVTENWNISFTIGSEHYTAQCAVAYEHRYNVTADYALCETDRVVKDIPYESLHSVPGEIRIGDTMLLAGFGCTQKAGHIGVGGPLRIGEVSIRHLPDATSHLIQAYSPTVLCNGDSGGAAYAATTEGERYVIGVNSASDFTSLSQVASIHSAPARRFINAWHLAKKHPICGIHEDAKGCHEPVVQKF